MEQGFIKHWGRSFKGLKWTIVASSDPDSTHGQQVVQKVQPLGCNLLGSEACGLGETTSDPTTANCFHKGGLTPQQDVPPEMEEDQEIEIGNGMEDVKVPPDISVWHLWRHTQTVMASSPTQNYLLLLTTWRTTTNLNPHDH